jgi:ribosome-associated protein
MLPSRFASTASTVGTLRPHPKGLDDSLTTLEQARRIAAIAQDKLAQDVVILDMRPACTYTDFFVIASGQNPRQTAAIYDEVHKQLKHEARLLPQSVDGQREATWVVADYIDVVLHVFTPEARAYYRLEDLWGDVPNVELEAATA